MKPEVGDLIIYEETAQIVYQRTTFTRIMLVLSYNESADGYNVLDNFDMVVY